MGFKLVTSAIPVPCSTNWAVKQHIGRKVNLLSSYLLMGWNDVKYIWNPYLYCSCRYNIFHIISLLGKIWTQQIDITPNELNIYRTDDAKSLVPRLCEIVTNKLSSDTTVYCIQFIACTCQISEGMKQKILRCYKYSKQNKKRNSNEKEEILCWTRTRKKKRKLCLERFCHYYNNVKNKK